MDYLNLISQNGPLLKKKLSRPQKLQQAVDDAYRRTSAYLLKNDLRPEFPSDAVFYSNDHVYLKYTFSFDSYDSKQVQSNARIQAFINEMKNTVAGMVITEEEANRTLSFIILDLENTLKNHQDVRQHEWQCYGSYRNGLCCKNSDIDLYFRPLEKMDMEIVPKTIEKLLKKSKSLFKKVFFLDNAKVPIIKLVHENTGKEVDISFCEIGVHTTKLMKLYCTLNDNLKILTLYLKQLLSKYKLQGPQKITTTILFWLVVYFMQQKKLLPPVIEVRRAAEKKCYISGYDCSVPDKLNFSSHDSGNLYLLLRDFFKFYRDLDFLKYVTCPLVGRAITIYDFKNLEIPEEEFSIYLKKIRDGELEKDGFSIHLINLQHPTLLNNNIAVQVGELIVNKFKILCHRAYEKLPYNSYSVIPTMSLATFLSRNFHLRRRSILKQFTFGYETETTDADVLRAIRIVMETALRFKVLTISPMNDDKKKETTSVIFFEYYADSETRKNSILSKIFVETSPLYQKPMCLIICKRCRERKEVQIWLQSELDLRANMFLIQHLKNLLITALK